MHNKIKQLMKAGVYNQHVIFDTLYPTYGGHYSTLRNLIAEVKNNG